MPLTTHHTLSLRNPALPNTTDVLSSDECADDHAAALAAAHASPHKKYARTPLAPILPVHPAPTTYHAPHQPFVISNYPPPSTSYPPPANRHPPTANRQPPPANRQPSTATGKHLFHPFPPSSPPHSRPYDLLTSQPP